MTSADLGGGAASAKAIALHERVLGARTEGLQKFGDLPGPGGKPPAEGSNVHITLDFDDEADMAQKFEGLAADGKVVMPDLVRTSVARR